METISSKIRSLGDIWPWLSSQATRDNVASRIAEISSYCLRPASYSHAYYAQISLVDLCNPETHYLYKIGLKVALATTALIWIPFALAFGLPGVALRKLASCIQSSDFLYKEGDGRGGVQRQYPSNGEISLLSWNICGLAGGLPISCGGVMPWYDRWDGIVDIIKEENADIVCLYEAFQPKFSLRDVLASLGYHVYYNIGPARTLDSLSSGLIVASRYPMSNPHFTPFPSSTQIDGAKHLRKGFFSVDIVNDRDDVVSEEGVEILRISSTHLQSSKVPSQPLTEEKVARQAQLQQIIEPMEKVSDRCTIIVGDLNMTREELSLEETFAEIDPSSSEALHSWGGDRFYAEMVGDTPSEPMHLDRLLLARNGYGSIQSATIRDIGFRGDQFLPNALSDHAPIKTIIKLKLRNTNKYSL